MTTADKGAAPRDGVPAAAGETPPRPRRAVRPRRPGPPG